MKMKLMLASLVCASSMFADVIVSPSTLPQKAQEFLNAHFKGVNVGYVKQDVDSYEVNLVDGTEIDFIVNGDWKEVDGKYKGIPTGFIPKEVITKVQAAQPNAAIVEVDKRINGYKFRTNNMMEIYTDFKGNILGQKFDD
ncbi:PepSY-like domain-containing protein [Campylobacter lari]|nr:PepSY-like domain-containing protein [Campylobacter lari]HEG5919688.1 PepSY-like domain-containing protein [Campylobacter lari]